MGQAAENCIQENDYVPTGYKKTSDYVFNSQASLDLDLTSDYVFNSQASLDLDLKKTTDYVFNSKASLDFDL